MLLHPTSSLNSQQQLQELLSSGGKGRFRPLGFHPLALEMWREKGSGMVGLGKRGQGWCRSDRKSDGDGALEADQGTYV